MKTFKQFLKGADMCRVCGQTPCNCTHVSEEVAVNNAGSGNVPGIGVGPQGEPGGRKAIMNKMFKRKAANVGVKVST